MKLKNYLSTLVAIVATAVALDAQVVQTESFELNGPYPTRNLPLGWSQNYVNRPYGNQNNFTCSDSGAIPAVSPHSGNGLITYNCYLATMGSSCHLVSKPFDLTARTSSSNVRFWMYRSSGAPTYSDSLHVYISNSPDLSGINSLLVDTASGLDYIVRYYNSPPAVASPGWYLYGFAIPNLSQYNISTAYIIIRGTSAFGENIHLDDFSIDTYPSQMNYQSTTSIYKDKYCMEAGSLNNVITGINIKTAGALYPYKLDSLNFNTVGSNNPCFDLTTYGVKLWYTGGTPFFDETNALLLDSDYLACNIITLIPPSTFSLDNGDNNFWLTYDISLSPPAILGDSLDAHFTGANISMGSSGNGYKTPALSYIQGKRYISGFCYCYPKFYYGTSSNTWCTNDFIQNVTLAGEFGYPPGINNSCNSPGLSGCGGCWGGGACCPYIHDYPYYENFPPHPGTVATLVANGTTVYPISLQNGTYGSGNCLAAWIDFNHDGIFNNTMWNVGGEKILQTLYPPGNPANGITSGVFIVPVNSFIGYTTMRVRESYAQGSMSPCLTYDFGETEDYALNILPGPVGITKNNNSEFNIVSVINNENSIKIDFNYNTDKPYTFKIIDAAGRIIDSQENLKAIKGINSLTITRKIDAGIYIIVLQNETSTIYTKFFR